MKAKKIVALTLSAAMAISTAALLAACKPDNGDGPGGNYVEDTTVYHCAGQSAGPDGSLYQQGWNQTAAGATEKVTFVKDTTITDENVFTLEMKLYAGDMFKIVHDEKWAGEITSYYFTNAEEDATYHWVAKTDGEVIFRDESGSSSNITLTEGHDGIYKFTLKTNLSATEDKDKYQLSYELVQSIDRLKIPYDMKVLGDFNGFGKYQGGVMSNSNGVWSTIIEIKADDLNRNAAGEEVETGATHSAVYIANMGDGENDGDPMAYVDETGKVTIKVGGEDTDVNLLTEGKWAISFNQETKAVTVSEFAYEMYFIGSFCNWETDKGYESYPLTVNSVDGTWSGKLTLTEDAQVQLFNANGATSADKYIPGTNYNLTAGTWVFKFSPDTGAVEYEKLGYYLVGTFVDEEGASQNFKIVKGLTPVMEATETPDVYKVTYEVKDVTAHSEYSGWLPANGIFGIQVVYGTSIGGVETWNVNGGNQYFAEAGTYEITIDLSQENPTATWTLVTE